MWWFSYFDLFWWHLAHQASDIRHRHYSSDISTIRGKLSCCFHHLCWGLVSIQDIDLNDFTGNQRHWKQHGIFVEDFGHREVWGVFVQSELLQDLKLYFLVLLWTYKTIFSNICWQSADKTPVICWRWPFKRQWN